MRASVTTILIAAILFPLTAVGADTELPSLQHVLKQMEEQDQLRSAALSRYTCIRHYALDNRRFHVTAELSVKMTYSSPGHKEFQVVSERGPAVIRKKVLRRMLDEETEASTDDIRQRTRITSLNYEFRLLSVEAQQGRPAYVLAVTPKVKNKFSMSGRVWVDCEDFAIVRIEAVPAKNPSAVIRNTHIVQQYQKVGQAWLPLFNHSESDSFLFGRTEVTIDSSEYEITQNSGASGAP